MDNQFVEVEVENLENNPHCLHGPTLLFKRLCGKVKEYYACSASRDHKDCNFFLPLDDITLSKSRRNWKREQELIIEDIKKKNLYKKYLKIFNKICKCENCQQDTENKTCTKLETAVNVANYCYSCSTLFLASDKSHNNCTFLSNLTLYQLSRPTEIIIPKTNARYHAQYFFSKRTVNDIELLLKRLQVSKILCIGAPRIHEHIMIKFNGKLKSLLLDLDKNYYNFYSKNQFIWYNMFNNHIFDEEQKEILHSYLHSGKVVVLMDPPFGGRVEPLAQSLKLLSKTCQCNQKRDALLQTFWFFPYFMEQHIQKSLPDFKMFDYKVNYENHSSFTDSGSRKRKFGSPVRIFTNVPLARLNLDGISGYKFCKFCGYWVSAENRHCDACQTCTSKNGRTYVHCSKCSKCVKPSYDHCDACGKCLPAHTCGSSDADSNCFHCHTPGHKRAECPHLNSKMSKRKRRKIT